MDCTFMVILSEAIPKKFQMKTCFVENVYYSIFEPASFIFGIRFYFVYVLLRNWKSSRNLLIDHFFIHQSHRKIQILTHIKHLKHFCLRIDLLLFQNSMYVKLLNGLSLVKEFQFSLLLNWRKSCVKSFFQSSSTHADIRNCSYSSKNSPIKRRGWRINEKEEDSATIGSDRF